MAIAAFRGALTQMKKTLKSIFRKRGRRSEGSESIAPATIKTTPVPSTTRTTEAVVPTAPVTLPVVECERGAWAVEMPAAGVEDPLGVFITFFPQPFCARNFCRVKPRQG